MLFRSVAAVRGSIALVTVATDDVERVSSLPCVEVFELARAATTEMNNARVASTVDPIHAGTDLSQPYTGKGVIAACVDQGLDANHANFKNPDDIQNNTVQLTDPYTQIDLGAIAKGYIADRIKDYLEEQGVKHATINLGGNIQTIGTKPDGSDYNIGIQKPFDETGEPITSVKIKDKSIVTTGIYQRYFEQDGTLYHHVLDPRTGMPCDTDLYSVSIITDSSLTADAMSTVCCLMGYQESMNVISQLDNVDAVFVTDDGNIKYSSNFQKKQPK